jgi:hypothetical protein
MAQAGLYVLAGKIPLMLSTIEQKLRGCGTNPFPFSPRHSTRRAQVVRRTRFPAHSAISQGALATDEKKLAIGALNPHLTGTIGIARPADG